MVIVDDFGNVGIGTLTPDRKLEVEDFQAIMRLTTDSSSSGSILELRNNSTQTLLGKVSFLNSSGSIRGQLAYRGTDEAMTFTTNALERMRLDSAGNVGIGTTIPTSRLHVRSESPVPLHVESDAGNGTWFNLRNLSAGGRNWSLISSGETNPDGTGELQFFHSSRGPVARLTPERIAAHPTSHTGRFLAEVLGTLPLEPAQASREA